MWRYLAWLTAILATIQAIGLTAFMVGDQRSSVTSTVGLLTIGAIVLGTMMLFWSGRLIDEFGIPAGYGVWFL
jgi:preprotein translocase subunit SecY